MPSGQQHDQLYQRLINAVTLQRAGQTVEAARLYRTTLCEAPDNADALHLLGVILWRNEGRVADALILMSRALTIDPRSSLVPYNIAGAMDEAKSTAVKKHNSGLKEEAEFLYKAILRHQPDNIDVLNIIARLYDNNDTKSLEKRIEIYRRRTVHQQSQREYWVELGYVLEQANRLEEATAAYATGTGHPVDSYAYCIATANALFNVRFGIDLARQQFPHVKLERIIQLLQRALELNPHSSEAHLTLARARRIHHQVDQALADIDVVLSLTPLSFEANVLRGHMLYRKGRLDEAQTHYQAGIEAAQEAIKSLQIIQRDLAHIEKIKKTLAATPPTADSRSAPIIFIHFGYNDYLIYATASARLSNPEKDIILIGDDSNKFVSQYGVKHFNIEDFNNEEKILKFRSICKFVHGMSTVHDKVWNKFCFERWFILYNFIKKSEYSRFWIFDSDTMIFENLEKSEANLSVYDWTEQSCGSNIGGLVNSFLAFEDYINFINDEYDSIVGSCGATSSDGMSTGITCQGSMDDMMFYWNYRQHRNNNTKNLGDIVDGTTFNDLIWRSIKEDEWERGADGVRSIYFENGHFYHAVKESGSKILINGANMSFVTLDTMGKYFDMLSRFRLSSPSVD